MKYTQLYIKTKKTTPKQDSISAYLLDKAGYVSQSSAGVFSLLPLGLRSIVKITQIIREEMNVLGASEVNLPSMQTKALWGKSGRWDDKAMKEILYKDAENEVCFAPTHEELVTELVKPSIQSYRDLPVLLYQFQTKFRKELRPRSGMLRGREFLMKDLYSFHPTLEEHSNFYEEVVKAYQRIFSRLGLETYRTKASGGVFGKEYSDEFQVICPNGEDEILVNKKDKTGFNQEVGANLSESDKRGLERVKSIEVGNIFHLGTKYADAFKMRYLDKEGNEQSVFMGSYGIGITRLLATLAELNNDEEGLKLPAQIAPFQVYLIDLTDGKQGEKLEKELAEANLEVLYDNREVGAGEKFADADLIGCPYRLIYSRKTAEKDSIEVKERATNNTVLVKLNELSSYLSKNTP